MNEDNYDRLSPQRKQSFLWKAKDKRKHKDYKWETPLIQREHLQGNK